jgi:serine protease Do
MQRSRVWRTFLLVALVVGGLVASPLIDVRVSFRDNVASAIDLFGEDEDEATPADSTEPFWSEGRGEPLASPPAGAPMSFADLADAVKPAIVNIRTRATEPSEVGPQPRQRSPFPGFPFGGTPRAPTQGMGTGFIISADGYVITNNHVIDNFDEIIVQLNDGTDEEARVIGRDPNTDVALLKIETDSALPALPLGDSDSMRAGDWVIAIGNALGLENTVTAGIVSAKHRVINQRDQSQRRFDDFLQTDAAINPGNSGGPLLNLAGEVVGINTAIRRDGNDVGFAVPINIAKQILPQLRTAGRVSRGWLGVRIQELDDATAKHFGIDDARGALVAEVDAGSPAEDAGLHKGDVIVSFNGKAVPTMEALPKLVAALPGGASARVEVIRDGKNKRLTVKLGELDGGTVVASQPSEAPKSNPYGLTVQELTDSIASQLDLDNDGGVVISQVDPESLAAEAGLQRGEVILEVDYKVVSNVRQFEKALKNADSEKGPLLYVRHRGGASTFVPLPPNS